MKPYSSQTGVDLYLGDCLEVMRQMPECSVDSVVCDPPYGLEFMQCEWDKLAHVGQKLPGFSPGAPAQKGVRGEIKALPQYDGAGNVKCPECGNWYQGRDPSMPNKRKGYRCVCGGARREHRKQVGSTMQAWHEAWAREAIRVLRPGGFLLAFGGTRTVHRLTCAIEDAGFEIRDTIQWIYGSGFPKSKSMRDIDKPELGTALKPAHEPIVMARKPLSESSVARNVLEHSTGAINIAATRVGNDVTFRPQKQPGEFWEGGDYKGDTVTGSSGGRWPANLLISHSPECQRVGTKRVKKPSPPGGNNNRKSGFAMQAGAKGYADRDGMEEVESWICAECCPIAELDRQSGTSKSTGGRAGGKLGGNGIYGSFESKERGNAGGLGDSGGASRYFLNLPPENTTQFHEPDTGPGFFYCAKSSRRERNQGLEGLPEKAIDRYGECGQGSTPQQTPRRTRVETNTHPCVKPLALCDWLTRLCCPSGGTILDPFMGSGSIGCSAVRQGFNFIGIEQEAEYVEISRRRIAYWASSGQAESPKPKPLKVVSKPAESHTEAQLNLFEEDVS